MKSVNVKNATISKMPRARIRALSETNSEPTFYQQVQFPIHVLVYGYVRNILRIDLQGRVEE